MQHRKWRVTYKKESTHTKEKPRTINTLAKNEEEAMKQVREWDDGTIWKNTPTKTVRIEGWYE